MVDSEAFRFRSVTCRIVEDLSVQFLGSEVEFDFFEICRENRETSVGGRSGDGLLQSGKKDKVIAESGDEVGVNEESNRVIGMEDKGILESGDAVGVKDDLNRVVGMEKNKGIVESGDEIGVKDDLKREIDEEEPVKNNLCDIGEQSIGQEKRIDIEETFKKKEGRAEKCERSMQSESSGNRKSGEILTRKEASQGVEVREWSTVSPGRVDMNLLQEDDDGILISASDCNEKRIWHCLRQ
ncbi:hypothetical protein F2Q70_00036016 [Brassica cretica]|uniref:Uncharacterized protein n=1 Tax=Brassica cretica TaxID=69181 RepID=A0A8S9JWN6_BRACR|nr:hypothetical protein F2Q70_00036016 [Brassica cretica]